MGIFDRFTSQKGKAEKAAPKPAAEKAAKENAAKKASFQAVQADKPEPKEKGKDKAKSAPVAVSPKSTGEAHRVLLSAIVTEKSERMSRINQYAFAIAADATKKTVMEAVQSVYGIRPLDVTIINLPGKMVRYGRSVGRQLRRRKAMITLPAGKTIDTVST